MKFKGSLLKILTNLKSTHMRERLCNCFFWSDRHVPVDTPGSSGGGGGQVSSWSADLYLMTPSPPIHYLSIASVYKPCCYHPS